MNEAAERLLNTIAIAPGLTDGRKQLLEEHITEALAAERRATVERIRGRLWSATLFEVAKGSTTLADAAQAMRKHADAILDEEAARDTHLSQAPEKIRP